MTTPPLLEVQPTEEWASNRAWRWDGRVVRAPEPGIRIAPLGGTIRVTARMADPPGTPLRLRLRSGGRVVDLGELGPKRRAMAAEVSLDALGISAIGHHPLEVVLEDTSVTRARSPFTLLTPFGMPTEPWLPNQSRGRLRAPWISLLQSACRLTHGARDAREAARAIAEALWQGIPRGGAPQLSYPSAATPSRRFRSDCQVSTGRGRDWYVWDVDRFALLLAGQGEAEACEFDCTDCAVATGVLLGLLGVPNSIAGVDSIERPAETALVFAPHWRFQSRVDRTNYDYHDTVKLADGTIIDPLVREAPGTVLMFDHADAWLAWVRRTSPWAGLVPDARGAAPFDPRLRFRMVNGKVGVCEDIQRDYGRLIAAFEQAVRERWRSVGAPGDAHLTICVQARSARGIRLLGQAWSNDRRTTVRVSAEAESPDTALSALRVRTWDDAVTG